MSVQHQSRVKKGTKTVHFQPGLHNIPLEDIEKLDRFGEPPDEGLLPELLWSDPQPAIGYTPHPPIL